MTVHGRYSVLVAGFLFFGLSAASGQGLSKAEIARLGKASTAYVEVPSRNASGSAFCIHPSGLFITNEHVTRGAGDITLVLNAGQKSQKVLKAKSIRSDAQMDLALLQVEGQKDLPSLALGADENLSELTEVVACGFPFGQRLAANKDYPAISINQGSIASLRQKDGKLYRIQLDVELNPGNSGGPVLDSHGKVVGVVVAGLKGARVNFAIPVSHLSQFVQRPEIQFVPPALDRATVHTPLTFEARALTILPLPKPPTLELVLRNGQEKERRFKMEPTEGSYRVQAAVVPPRDGPLMLRLRITYASGSIQGSVEDRPFKVGGNSLRLKDIKQLQLGEKPRAVLADGKALEGPLTGLDAVPVQLGGEIVTLNFLKATDAQITSPTSSVSVLCTVIATHGGKEIGRLSKRIGYGGTTGDDSGNLLVNGSFEEFSETLIPPGYRTLPLGSTTTKGWVVSRGDVDQKHASFWQAAHGSRSLDLNGTVPGGISQAFPTIKGQTYLVTFNMAGNPDGEPKLKRLGVRAAGASAQFEFDTTGKSHQSMGWETKTWEFTAIADKTTLEFYSLSPEPPLVGPALDNVMVVVK